MLYFHYDSAEKGSMEFHDKKVLYLNRSRLSRLFEDEIKSYEIVVIEYAHCLLPVEVDFLRQLDSQEIHCFGLRRDERGEPFAGSVQLLIYSQILTGDLNSGLPGDKQAVSFAEKDNAGFNESCIDDYGGVHPLVIEFLDAGDMEERISIFRRMKAMLDDEVIDTLAMSLDVEVPEGEIDDRADNLLSCMETMKKYETTRLRW